MPREVSTEPVLLESVLSTIIVPPLKDNEFNVSVYNIHQTILEYDTSRWISLPGLTEDEVTFFDFEQKSSAYSGDDYKRLDLTIQLTMDATVIDR